MKSFSQYIKESPDSIIYDGVPYNHSEFNAQAFMYYKNNFFVGESGQTHFEVFLEQAYDGDEPDENEIHGIFNDIRDQELLFQGRVWTIDGKKKGVISFWDTPSPLEINKVVKDLKHNNIPIDVNNWVIEIRDGDKSKFIPIQEYIDSNIKVKDTKPVIHI